MILMRHLPLALVLALVAAPSALADSHNTYKLEAQESLSFGTAKVRGYTLSGSVVKTKSGEYKGTSLYLSLSKQAKGTGRTATQTHSFSWDKKIKLTSKRGLSGGKITARLGKYGSIKLRFQPTRKTRARKAQPPCTGKKDKTRRGKVTGTFKLVADKKYFKTIRVGTFKRAILSVTPTRTCKFDTSPVDPGKQPVMLSTTGAGALSLFMSEDKGGVSQNATLTEREKNPRVTRSIFASTSDRSKFDHAANASSATASGIAPWLSGSLTFTASEYFSGGATGKIRGNYTVKFDSAGKRRPFATGDVNGYFSKPGFTPPPPPNQAPTAGFSSQEGSGPREIAFFDDSFDPDGAIESWSWDFGDGTTSTQQNPTHVYGAAGTYQVKLTIRDDRGATATATNSVTVNDPPPEGEFRR